MTAIVTKKTRIANADNFIEAFSELSSDRYYLGIGRDSVWASEPTPDIPKDNDETVTGAWNNLIGMKLVSPANIKTVIKNVLWETGTIYEQYSDKLVGMFYVNGVNVLPVYAINSSGRIYKCIETPRINGIRQPSTVMPNATSSPVFQTADGYRWKYMGDVSLADYNAFATDEYFPVKPYLHADDGSDQWLQQDAAIDGAVHCIEVNSGGTGYTDGAAITLTTSTGTGFTGTIVAPTGTITKINVTNAGSGYRDAVVNLTGTGGNGASLRAILSPIGGHSSHLREELEGIYVMVKCILDSTEGGVLPVGSDFRQVFLVKNPKTTNLGMKLVLTGYSVDVPFTSGTTVKSGVNQGTVVSWDSQSGVLYVSGITTGFTGGQSLDIVGGDTGVATISDAFDDAYIPATAIAYAAADIAYGSGELVYIENRVKIQRNLDQTEDVRLVIEF